MDAKTLYPHLSRVLPALSRQRPLTLAEKILVGHLAASSGATPQEAAPQGATPQGATHQDYGAVMLPSRRGKSFLSLQPDRVAMQDATAQMALLQFILSGRNKTVVPATVHCDHLIRAYEGMEADMQQAMQEHQEVYDFLASASNRYGIGFWKPGAGIIHQVVLEHYAFPGGLMIGTDSHTPNAGGLGMLACGVGGADAAEVMAGLPWEVKHPQLVGVHLKGKLQGWASPKDIILKLCGIMTVKGGTNKIVEYFGHGAQSISCTGKGTITNMGAELGATCSVFPFDEAMHRYLKSTERSEVAELAEQYREHLVADNEVQQDPHSYYDEVIEIDLSTLEPHIVGPHSPDAARPISEMKAEAQKQGWPVKLSAALVGSCTNSSYEDIGRAAHIAKQAFEVGRRMPQQFMVSPGSLQIKKTIERDGQLKTLESVGATVLANACGPCIGQWKREDFKRGEVNTIISSFNRNFRGRNDANPETLSFLASPDVTMALGLAGRLDFNPMTDELPGGGRLQAPTAPELPQQGFVTAPEAYVEPKGVGEVMVAPKSKRLQKLKPFVTCCNWSNVCVLAKVKGKCTTDHISPAGRWLQYRGHLENISDNMLTGAVNAFTGEVGQAVNILTGSTQPYAQIAKHYKQQGQPWMIVGDENYGEGSSREHAAMSPRFLGGVLVLARSFARIHESNLKKQGVLALRFTRAEDYDLFQPDTRVCVDDVPNLSPGKTVRVRLMGAGQTEAHSIECEHSFTSEQIKWFHAGSALNYVGRRHS